eukprot:COSAG04_NODE_614_length_11938_cov_3.550384_7_plen_196_part_00
MQVAERAIETGLIDKEPDGDESIGCGAAVMLIYFFSIPHAFAKCDSAEMFDALLKLLQRIYPSPLPPEWWVSTCAVIDVTSVRLGPVLQCLSYARLLDQSALESASWLGRALETAVHLVKVNASAGLSARPTMSLQSALSAFRIVEMAARVESHSASLLDSGVIEALDYACLNDFECAGSSVSEAMRPTGILKVG